MARLSKNDLAGVARALEKADAAFTRYESLAQQARELTAQARAAYAEGATAVQFAYGIFEPLIDELAPAEQEADRGSST